MSVTYTRNVAIIPWRRGPGNLAYPSARWLGWNYQPGDATGGTHQMIHVIEDAGKYTQRLYSLEHATAYHETTVAEVIHYLISGFDQAIQGIAPTAAWQRAASASGTGINREALPGADLHMGFPFYHRSGTAISLSVQAWLDNRDSIQAGFWAWGWVWDATAFETDTGPLKPW